MRVEVEVISAGDVGVFGFTLSSVLVADFAAFGTDTALVTLAAPVGVTGVLQGGLTFENPNTWGSVWPTSTQVPTQGYGIMTHLFVSPTGIADIVKVIDDTQLVIKDPTGAFAALGNGVNFQVLDANYDPPARMTMTSTNDWWLGGSGDVNTGGDGQMAGFTYVVDTGRPYAVATLGADVFCVLEYYNKG